MSIARTRLRISPAAIAVAALFAAVTAPVAHAADVYTDFSGGNGTGDFNQFTGTTGGGWTTAWTGVNTSSTVTAASPLDGGGNYLSSARGGAANDATLRRRFDLDAGGMLSGTPYQVEWLWRYDGNVAQMTTATDRVHFFADDTAQTGSNNGNSWLIGVSATLTGNEFYFYRNTGATPGAFDASQFIDTNVALTAGEVYSFKVIVDPTHGTYDATIMNLNTGTTFSAADMKFRNAAFGAATTQYLHFGTSADVSTDNTTFSLDSLDITEHRKIVARFDDGEVANKIDTFNSASAGGGWASGWGTTGTATRTVTSDAPLGSGPYLQVAQTGTGLVRRQFTDFGEIDLDSDHRVSWQFRFDGNVSQLTTFDDRINFFADHDARTGTGIGQNSWLIGWVGGDGGGALDVYQGHWYFYDNRTGTSAFNTTNMVDTGFTLANDVIYYFLVVVHPETGTYDARISDGVSEFWAYGLIFRNGQTLADGVTWDRLHFGLNANLSTDNTSFSLDSITISVPTPAALPAGLGLLTLAAMRRRRR